ncbi:hypothetical protein [Nocardia bovistercoris]|uniref:EthD domain-containing protein n=1 Tax=Nocardia bovistercoris TaxID=2785916 RepID=A0A931IBQ3_9NOCA|nr:hypothetical protein [Nocardia bovistercoris]MBH0776920.1 hypothetical protein [Nocardia bovistercoris]
MGATKLIFALWGVSDRLAPDLVARCAAAGARAVHLNISDAVVATAMLRLTSFPAPVDAVVAVETAPDGDRDAITAAVAAAAPECAGWLVRERRPIEPPAVALGERTPGLVNIAFLRRPATLSYQRWLENWLVRHTPVAIETQATFGYIQNQVIEPVTPDAPEIAAIVEEHFPIEALTDPHAFYGSGGDAGELSRRIETMMRSVASFGADRDIDVVPTSGYRLL